MADLEDNFLVYNKIIEEKLDYLIHLIERQLDSLYLQRVEEQTERDSKNEAQTKKFSWLYKIPNSYSIHTFMPFRAPYIRDARNFSSPTNCDVKQIRELSGTDNIDAILKQKLWSRESKKHLEEAVLEHYAQSHIIKLIKQKNNLDNQIKQLVLDERGDLEQKMRLINEQIEQVKARQHPHTFVPQNRFDSEIDWLGISAKLTLTSHNAHDCRLMWTNDLHWSVNKKEWTRDEDASLLSAIEKHGANNWDAVAKELNNNRLPWQCCARYQTEFSYSCATGKPVTTDGIQKIIEVVNLCRIGNFIPWNQVMYFIQCYTLPQVKYQWQKYISDTKFASCPWTQEEDALLIRAVSKFGCKDWVKIASLIPNRSSRSCRERYVMRLKFEKRSLGEWRPKESRKLLSLAHRCELQWAKIADHFPDRNPHQIRGKFCSLQKQNNKSTGVYKIKKRILYKNAKGFLMSCNRSRQKLSTEREVDKKLDEIFNLYSGAKTSAKSLVCRSAQDETIYQHLVAAIRYHILSPDLSRAEEPSTLIGKVLTDALNEKVTHANSLLNMAASDSLPIVLAPPNVSTIRGYRCWALQQDYLKGVVCKKFSEEKLTSIDINDLTSREEYNALMKQAISLFLWPALLARLDPPQLNIEQIKGVFETSLVNKDTLYVVRELQKKITFSK